MQRDLEKRQDRGRYWWELRSCSYYDEFTRTKILYQDISFHSWFCFDDQGFLCNNTCYFLPTNRRWLVAVLNSSVMWWYLERHATHAKDEAFRLHTQFVEQLPIAEPSGREEGRVDALVEALIKLADARQQLERRFKSRLASGLGVDRPPRRVEQFWRLDALALGEEIRRLARLSSRGGATPAMTREYVRLAEEYRRLLAESLSLEFELQHLVFDLYGLTGEEVQLLRATAPPRDPLTLAEHEARALGLSEVGLRSADTRRVGE